MRVGLNLVYLVPDRTGGMETYARELVRALVAERPELPLTLFLNRETTRSAHGWGAFGSCVEVPVRAQIRADWMRGEQQLLPGLAQRHGCELVHSLGNTAPLRGRFLRVVTIHDLIHRRHPEAHGRASSAFLRFFMPRVARSSTRRISTMR